MVCWQSPERKLTTAEIEALRNGDREERRVAFLKAIAVVEEEYRFRLGAQADVGGRQGGLLLVGASPVLHYYEDFPQGQPPAREAEPEENNVPAAD